MPTRITAATPVRRGIFHLNDQQLGRIAALLDTDHNGRLASDEVSLSLAARGRLREPMLTNNALAVALRNEQVAVRQVPQAVAMDVARVLFSGPIHHGLPGALDQNRDGQVDLGEVANALTSGKLAINRHVRLDEGPAEAEEHFRRPAVVPNATVAQALSEAQHHLIRGNGAAAQASVLAGLAAVAAAGGPAGLGAYAVHAGVQALSQLPAYASHPNWVAIAGFHGLDAIARGETKPQAILAFASRQVLYERPDEEGARAFFTAALQVVQSQLAEHERGWESHLLRQLNDSPFALPILRQGMAGIETVGGR